MLVCVYRAGLRAALLTYKVWQEVASIPLGELSDPDFDYASLGGTGTHLLVPDMHSIRVSEARQQAVQLPPDLAYSDDSQDGATLSCVLVDQGRAQVGGCSACARP